MRPLWRRLRRWLEGLECYWLEDHGGRRVFKGSDGRLYAVEFVGVLVECKEAPGSGYVVNPEDTQDQGEYEVIGEVRVE